MKNKVVKTIVIIFTIIFFTRILTVFLADCIYSIGVRGSHEGMPLTQSLGLLSFAIKLDSSNASLYFGKYEILEKMYKNPERLQKKGMSKSYISKLELLTLKNCINLCPSWAIYHMNYAITLKRKSPRPNIVTRRLILSEAQKAMQLKPYSDLYRGIYERYLFEFSTTP